MQSVSPIGGEIRLITLDTGDEIELRMDDESVEIYFGDIKIGALDFRSVEQPGPNGYDETMYKMTHAFLEGENARFASIGIGTEAFRFFKEYTGANISFSDNDGITKTDGSHLSGNGAPFVESLKRKMRNGEL